MGREEKPLQERTKGACGSLSNSDRRPLSTLFPLFSRPRLFFSRHHSIGGKQPWVKNTASAGSNWGDGENVTLKVLDPKGTAHEVCLTMNLRMSWRVKLNEAK